MEAVINGVFSGIVLAFLIGPVFFTLIQTSIERGFWSGFFVAAGISLSDALYITICYLGLHQIFIQDDVQEYLAFVGGGVLLMFGFYYLFIKRKKLVTYDPEKVQTRSPFRLFMKGFIINGLSPMVLIFWLGMISAATGEFGYVSPRQAVPFFSAIVATVFLTDLLKAKLADRLRKVITPQVIQSLNLIVGLAMLAFGLKLLWMGKTLHGF